MDISFSLELISHSLRLKASVVYLLCEQQWIQIAFGDAVHKE